MDLNSVELFVKVVQKGSFSAASRTAGVPVATVSRRVSELEKSLGVRLLERSTRQLRLTGAGTTLYEFVSRGLQEMQAGELALQNRESELKGLLRLSLPPNFEPWWSLLKDFQLQFPLIEINVYTTERKIDLIEDGIDVALRIGDVIYQSAVARELTSYKHVLVATPEFIKTNGMPKSPQDLDNFPCVAWRNDEAEVEWSLGRDKIKFRPILKTNDYPHIMYMALQNKCITELPPFLASEHIANHRLIQLLPEYEFPEDRVSLLYPSRKQISRISRVYIDFCVEHSNKYLMF